MEGNLRKSIVKSNVEGISRKSNEKQGLARGPWKGDAREWNDLSEQSTDEGKPNDVTHLGGEPHSTTGVALSST